LWEIFLVISRPQFTLSLLEVSRVGEDVGTSGRASGNVEEYRVSTISLQTAVRPVAIAIGAIAEEEGEEETNGNVRTKGTMMCLLLSDSAECLVLRVEQAPVCVVRNNLVLDDLRNTI
jgi:hypothetical protein